VIAYDFRPGEGMPIPITYSVSTTSWTVTAAIVTIDGVALYTPTTERVDDYTWYVHVLSTHTTAIAALGTRAAVLRVTATAPALPLEPDIEEALIRVSPV
jgi:hypothetical protein